MSLVSKILRKGLYHFAHPLLRALRRIAPSGKESARVLLVYNNEVMLVRNIGTSRWSLPGGILAKGEALEACALRELEEELRITDAVLEYKLGTYHSHTPGAHEPVHVFVARAASLRHRRQWEIDEARWFTLGDLPPNLSSATARRIGEYKNGLRDVSAFW